MGTLSPKSVLVIYDDTATRRTLAVVLRREGSLVTAAQPAVEALEPFREIARLSVR
jgi:CheY-like chemotaxis protein